MGYFNFKKGRHYLCLMNVEVCLPPTYKEKFYKNQIYTSPEDNVIGYSEGGEKIQLSEHTGSRYFRELRSNKRHQYEK